jgi:lipoprotein NlpD
VKGWVSLRAFRVTAMVSLCAISAACVSSRPAPVVERTAPARSASAPAARPPVSAARPAPGRADPRPDSYTVKPGDTLYSIALEHGLDYRELAFWNGLDNPGAIKVGMQLRLTAPAGSPTVVAAPLKGAGGSVEGRPLGAGGAAPAAGTAAVASAPLAASGAAAPPSAGSVLTEPKGIRLPYSEQALAQLSKPSTAPPAAAVTRPEASPDTKPDSDSARAPDELDWAWPVKGKIVTTFNDTSSKGIGIAGKAGQPVLASAPGRVIFSGTGIRGFGKLVVIKHNNVYLSVYGHNSELNVKEGQAVTKGQKIAEMGSTDADQVKLHFEIRRYGKPVDPLKLLPSS